VKDKGETANYWDVDEVEWTQIPEDDEDILTRTRTSRNVSILDMA